MASIEVIFDLPEKIVRGLADGSLERVGGVIRRSGDKKIFAWLTETGEVVSNENTISSILASPQMLAGLQVANLAVNVAGFALIYHKLKVVENQLQCIGRDVQFLSSDHQYLDQKHLLGQLSPMLSALNTLREAHRISDQSLARDKLIAADNRLSDASIYFREVLGRMLAEKLEQERPDEFSACYRAWVMSSQGRIQSMAELGEIPLALDRSKSFKLEHQDFGRDFVAVRRDPLRRLACERASENAEDILQGVGMQSAGVHELIKGKELQLDYMNSSGLRLGEIPVIESSGKYGYALLKCE